MMTTERLAEELLSLTRMLRPMRGSGTDLTPEQIWLLRHLNATGPLSIGELANALGITTGSATVACQRLEKAGLVSRERQTADERIVQVTLTEQGQAQFDAWRQKKRAALAQLLNALDEHEQQELQRLIELLLSAAEAQGLGEERKYDSHH